MKKYLIAFSVISATLLLSACQLTDKTEMGSAEWYNWVESKVHVMDADGHGPDIGEGEWCSAVEFKLFNRQSGLEPCSAEWNQKVQAALSN